LSRDAKEMRVVDDGDMVESRTGLLNRVESLEIKCVGESQIESSLLSDTFHINTAD